MKNNQTSLINFIKTFEVKQFMEFLNISQRKNVYDEIWSDFLYLKGTTKINHKQAFGSLFSLIPVDSQNKLLKAYAKTLK